MMWSREHSAEADVSTSAIWGALRIAEVRPGELFVDEAEIGGAVIKTTHQIERLGGGRVRVVYRTEITGPTADQIGPEIGPSITADFPETIAALFAFAGR